MRVADDEERMRCRARRRNLAVVSCGACGALIGTAGFVWNRWISALVGTRVTDLKHTSMHRFRTAVLFMCDVRLACANANERKTTPFS